MKKYNKDALTYTFISTVIFFIGLVFVDIAIRHNLQIGGDLVATAVFAVISFFVDQAIRKNKSIEERKQTGNL